MSNTGSGAPAPVLVDTDVFSRVFIAPRRSQQNAQWAAALTGRTITIAVQTAVELRAWPPLRNWGNARTAALYSRIASVGTIQVSPAVQTAYVDLTVWAKVHAHAIHQKVHTADRWIAATAIAHGLEIAAGDSVYESIPQLTRFPGIP